MGNYCVGVRAAKDGFFHSISHTLWWSRSHNNAIAYKKKDSDSKTRAIEAPRPVVVQNKPPEVVKIVKEEEVKIVKEEDTAKPPEQLENALHVKQSIVVTEEETKSARESKKVVKENDETNNPPETKGTSLPKKPHNVKRMSSAGMRAESVLRTKNGHLKEHYNLGQKLGHGQFGTTFRCMEKATGKEYACKSIAKRKLITDEDVEDVRREIEILHHLSGEPNVVAIKGAYEDAVAVHVVMELCVGGELFDRITKRGHYTERKAANLAKTILNVIDACHSMGVMHRDLKPENFLFVNGREESPLKTIDFGLSVFFKPGTIVPKSCILLMLCFCYIQSY